MGTLRIHAFFNPFYIGLPVAVLAPDLAARQIAGSVPSPQRGAALAETFQYGSFIQHDFFFFRSPFFHLLCHPLPESGLEYLHGSDDNCIGQESVQFILVFHHYRRQACWRSSRQDICLAPVRASPCH